MGDIIEKVSIIISKGSLEGIYPGLIMANGARAEGIDANLFFTFFGLDAVLKARHDHIKVATVGNPGLHLATWVGGLPGMSAMVTHKLGKRMEELDFPPIPEFLELLHDSGAGLYARLGLAAAHKYLGLQAKRRSGFKIDFKVDPAAPFSVRNVPAFELRK